MPDEFLQETRLVVVASGDHFLQCQGEKGGTPGKKNLQGEKQRFLAKLRSFHQRSWPRASE
jgi:hypothetical protein